MPFNINVDQEMVSSRNTWHVTGVLLYSDFLSKTEGITNPAFISAMSPHPVNKNIVGDIIRFLF